MLGGIFVKDLRKPFSLEYLDKKALITYLGTEYAKVLVSELDELAKSKKITSLEKDLVLAIKSDEFYNFCTDGNAWDCVKYYLENFPELLTIHELFQFNEPTEKHFFIINSQFDYEFEKILSYQKLEFNKYQRELIDGRTISFYIIFLSHPKQYSLKNNPVRKVWSIAEDSGIRVGYHKYDSKEQMDGPYSLGLYRSFPVIADDFGDYSSATGGFRPDLEAGFKSSWEANIARLLNHKGLKWEYEKASESYTTEVGNYIPDFKVQNEGNSYVIEIKGFWDNRSVKKVSSALNQAKHEEIVIIDRDFYLLLEKKFGQTISNWEPSKEYKEAVFTLPVIGLQIGNRIKNINELQERKRLKLLREPNNQYDKNAIKVLTEDDNEIGYIAKEWASIFSSKMDCGFTYDVHLYKKELNKKRVLINLKTQPVSEDLINKIPFL